MCFMKKYYSLLFQNPSSVYKNCMAFFFFNEEKLMALWLEVYGLKRIVRGHVTEMMT